MRKPAKSAFRRRRPTQSRAHETVNAILDAVIRLLKRSGVSAITTNGIAEAAGVSICSVYQYFHDKRAIFVALHERHIEQVDRILERKISESASGPLKQLVSELMDGMIEAHTFDPELAALLDSEVPHRADGAKEFSCRLHELLRKALAPHAERLGGTGKLDLRAFLLGNMLDALGHAVVLRRPRAVSLRYAKMEATKAILAGIES